MNRTLRDALRQRTATHVLGLLAGLLCSCGAWAAERPKHVENNFEITPFYGQMGGGRFQDPLDSSDRDVDSN
ncbi:MAG: hypothetical protein ACJ8MH_19100, partial [Povalibacter sp.]